MCLKAEASPQGSITAASASPRRFDASALPCVGVIASVSPRLRVFCPASRH